MPVPSGVSAAISFERRDCLTGDPRTVVATFRGRTGVAEDLNQWAAVMTGRLNTSQGYLFRRRRTSAARVRVRSIRRAAPARAEQGVRDPASDTSQPAEECLMSGSLGPTEPHALAATRVTPLLVAGRMLGILFTRTVQLTPWRWFAGPPPIRRHPLDSPETIE